MKWVEFKRAAPELVRVAERLFKKSGVILLGTARRDGSPRISPVEPLIVDGELYLGMMWRSLKALDLLRDPRCTVHSAVRDRFAREGEFKLHGRATDIRDPQQRRRYCNVLYKKIKWRPAEPNYHLFAVDVLSAATFMTKGDARVVKLWRAGQPVRTFRQTPETYNPKDPALGVEPKEARGRR